MGMSNHKIGINVAYNIDKNGLNQLKSDLAQLKMNLGGEANVKNLTKELQASYKAADQLEGILNKSWNSKLGQFDLSKMNKEIQSTYGSVNNLKTAFTTKGFGGEAVFNSFASQILNTNIQLKQTSKLLDDMAVSMGNTIKWGITSSIFNNMTSALQKSWDYSVNLDKSLNDIRIVTGKSADEMERFAKVANTSAKNLGASTRDFAEASLIYYQQGYDTEATQLAEITLKAANVTGQSGSEVSEQLTAVWNGYNVANRAATEGMQIYEEYIDKLAAVAAVTASDLEELSTGMSKVASAANLMGVDIDQLNATIATVVSVTRQAPESVGTAFKTIYARMGDIEAGLDAETTLGSYTEKMKEIAGINVLDSNKQLRDMGDVIEEVGEKWNSLSREQQVALSQVMAGTRQYNNLLSLFDNWDMYEQSIEVSKNAKGTLEEQNAIYKDSVEARMQMLSTEAERTYDIIFDEDVVKGFINVLTGGLSLINNLLDGLGGGFSTLIGLGGMLTTLFNKQLGQSIERFIENQEAIKNNLEGEDLKRQVIQAHSAKGEHIGAVGSSAVELEAQYAEKILNIQRALSEEEAQELITRQQELGVLESKIEAIKQYETIAKDMKEKGVMNFFDIDHLDIDDFTQGIEQVTKTIDDLTAEKEELDKFFDILKQRGPNRAKTLEKRNIDVSSYNTQLGLADIESMPEEEKQKIQSDPTGRSTASLYEYEKQEQKLYELLVKYGKENKRMNELADKFNKKHILSNKEIAEIYEFQTEEKKRQRKLLGQLETGAEGYADASAGVLDNLEAEKQDRQAILDQMIEQKERALAISNAITAASSLVTVATAVSGMMQSFADGELTLQDFTQTLTTVIALLPSLISGYKALVPLNTAMAASWAAQRAEKQKLAVLQALTIKRNTIENEQQAKKVVAAKIAQVQSKTGIKLTQQEVALQLIKNGKLTEEMAINAGLIPSKAAKTAVEEVGTKATLKATIAQWAHNASLYASPLFWIAAIILGVVAAIAALVSITKASAERQREANDAAIESANAKQTEIDKNLELVESYQDVYQAYKEGKASKNELEEATKTLVDILGEEEVRIANLTGDYEKLNEKILEYQKNKLKEGKSSAETEQKSAAGNVEASAIDGQGHRESGNTKYSIDFDGWSVGKNEEKKAWEALMNNAGDYYRSGAKDFLGSAFVIETDYDAESIVELYDSLVAARNEMMDNMTAGERSASGLYQQVNDWINKMSEDVEKYKEATADVAKYATSLEAIEIDFGSIDDYETFKTKRQEFIDAIKLLDEFKDKTDEELEAIADTYIMGSSETADQFLNKLAGTESLMEVFGDSYKAAIEEAYDGLSSGELAGLLDEQNTTLKAQFEEMVANGVPAAEAIKMLGKEYKKTAIDSLMLSESIKNQLEELDYSEEAFSEFVDQLRKENKVLDDNIELAQDVALVNVKMNKGLADLSENYEDLGLVLKANKRNTSEFAEALEQMQGIMANILNLESGDLLSEDFYTSAENLKLMKQAAEGNIEAIEKLRQAAGNDILAQVKAEVNDQSVLQAIAELDNFIDTYPTKDLEVGAQLQDEEFVTKLQGLIDKSQMTTEQVQAYLNSMGYDPEITETKPVKQKTTHWGSYPEPIYDSDGSIKEIKAHPYQWTSEDEIQVPIIKSVTYNKPDKKTINFSNTATGKAAKSSGSGSKPKKEGRQESEKDRYHDINIGLAQVSNNLEKVQEQTDRLVGQSKIDNLADQYGLLNDQIDLTAEKIDIARGEMGELRQQLEGKGVQFNSDGTIANYAAAYDAQLAYVNSIIDRYNSMSAKQQEAYQDTLDKAKEDFEAFTEAIENYDSLLTEDIPGMQAEIQEALNKQIELKLEAFHHEIELRLDMADAERDWNEFFNKVIKDIDEDDILGNAQAKLQDFMSYYKENLEGVIQVGTQHIEDILTDLKTMDAGGDAKYYSEDGVTNRAQALEDLKTYYEQLMEDLESIHDLSDEIHESYVDMIDEAQEKFDEQISTFETINDLIEHDKNVISMIYGEEAYSSLSQFYDKQEENYNKQLDFQKQQVEFWKIQMATAEEGSDAWNAAKENWLSAVDEWNNAVETAIENLQDKYLNAINAIFQNLNNNVTNGMGLDFVETEWDLINQNADQYLDTVNAIYKVQELQNKYLDAIDKTNSPAQQKKLNDLMQQETDYLREQDKLSEYDLERANLKYELALKQMALEEAQQNKTQLRLRRDSQGNYTYQYTQDDDQVASIQSEIADLYNQLYNLDAEQYRGNLEEIYDIWNEFQERMAEAAQINDPEQRAAKELLIKQQYSDLINGLVEKNENLQANLYQSTMSHLFDLYNQNTANYADMSEDQKAILDMFINAETDLTGAAFDNMFDLYNVNIEQFKNMTDEQQDILMSSMIPQWNSGVQQMTDKIAGEGGFVPTCKDAFEELDKATEDYMTGLEELQKNADVSFEDVKNGINDVVVETEKLLENNDELIEKYGKEIEAIQSVIDELEGLIKKYEDAKKAAEDATKAAYEYWQQEQNKNAEVDPNLDKPKEEQPAAVNNTPAPAPAPVTPAKPSLSKGSYVEVKSGTRWYADSYGGGSSGNARAGTIKYTSSGPYGYNIDGLGWVRKTDIVGYDTGGYTGSWSNNNGRLAMLHQKELVLNANDTANMLSAITILRDITANLGATLLNKMAAISAGNPGSVGQGLAAAGMEQNVVINAEFPNATSSKEIEDALNNLVNRASQHITK